MDKLTTSPEAAYLTSPNIIYPQSERGVAGEAQTEAAEAAGRSNITDRYGVDASSLDVQRARFDPPLPPENLAGDPTDTTVELTWDASAYADGYKVIVDDGDPLDVGNVLTYLVEDLDPETSYDFAVLAYNEIAGDGEASDPVTVETLEAA
jgi:hypothetical protein